MPQAAIREFLAGDAEALRRCVVELQEFERAIDPCLPPGDAIADGYCERLHAHCREAGGRVFVAEHAGEVIGFVAVMAREPFTEPDDPAGTYGLVTDLMVLTSHRGQGVGRRLLAHAEVFARAVGARELRVGLLARNANARRLYLDAGFTPFLEVLAKRW